MITAKQMLWKGYEFFILEDKIYLLHKGKTTNYNHFSPEVFEMLKNLMIISRSWKRYQQFDDPYAQFIANNFANFDDVSDIDENGNATFEGMINLSRRELEYVKLNLEDLPDKMIADQMHISINTATTHRQRICNKLKVFSKVGLAVTTIKQGIV